MAQLNEPWSIYITDLETLRAGQVGEDQAVLQGVRGMRQLNVSPNGQALAFRGTYRGHSGLWIYNLNSRELVRVWPGFGPFDWSPDGKELIVLVREPDAELFRGKPARIELPASLVN
jgi:Tol biopolymer transport system component